MSYLICTPVVGDTLIQFLDNLKTTQTQSDFIELRIDFIQDLNMSDLICDLNQIKAKITKKTIFTCRANWEGGYWNGTEENRLKILQWSLNAGFDYVDIEVKTVQKHSKPILNPKNKVKKKKNQELDKEQEKLYPSPPLTLDLNLKKPETKLILSYHNFQKTDNYRKLRKTQKMMQGYNCDICKFACTITKSEDNIILTQLLVNKKKSDQLIVLGMGKNSSFMRINTVILGGYLTFGTVNDQVSASGQMSLTELQIALADRSF